MAEFASKGVAGSGLGLGIAGTALGLLNNGGLGGILGGGYGGCHENMPVNRYELAKEQEIAALKSEKALLEANIFTDGKLNDFRNYVDRRFNGIEAQMCQQNVYNATNTAAIGCIQAQVAALQGLTKVVIPLDNICPQPTTTTTTG
jgi:hypothetical protein